MDKDEEFSPEPTRTQETLAHQGQKRKKNIRRHAWRAISFEPSPASKVRHARKYACLPFHQVSVPLYARARAAGSIGLQHELGIKGHRTKASLRARTREKKGRGIEKEKEEKERW